MFVGCPLSIFFDFSRWVEPEPSPKRRRVVEGGSSSCAAQGCSERGTEAALREHWSKIHCSHVVLFLCPYEGCGVKKTRKEDMHSHLKMDHLKSAFPGLRRWCPTTNLWPQERWLRWRLDPGYQRDLWDSLISSGSPLCCRQPLGDPWWYLGSPPLHPQSPPRTGSPLAQAL